MDWLLDLDRSLFLAINGWHSGIIDSFMVLVSGRITWLPVYALIVYLFFKDFGWKGVLGLVILAGLGILISDQVSSSIFKPMVERLRPCHDPGLAGLVHVVNGKCGGQFGFVSSHAANFGFLAAFVWGVLRKRHFWISIGLTFSAVLVGYSRVYLGVHYPLDILGGFFVGVSAALLVLVVRRLLLPYFPYIER